MDESEGHSMCVTLSLPNCYSNKTEKAISYLDEDPSEEIVFKPFSKGGGIHRTDNLSEFHRLSNSSEKKRSPTATSVELAPMLVYPLQNKSRKDEAYEPESEPKSFNSDECEEDNEGGSSEKRRRVKCEMQADGDGDTGEGEGDIKRRKTKWVSDDLQLKMLGPIHLPDFVKDSVETELDAEESRDLMLRLVEINGKLLKSSELSDDRSMEDRSPSPEPVHDNLGRRINTRVLRLRKKLEQERQRIILKMVRTNHTFETPPEYEPPKLFKKLYVPIKQYPDYNFVGLILGPRGNTQKRMEKETGAKILLRGKGSLKRPQKQETCGEDDLHVLVEADNRESLNAAVKMIEKLLIPLNQGDGFQQKRAQLEELAKLNGTTYRVRREKENKRQQSSCGAVNNNTCATCGSFCHPSSNCPLTTTTCRPQVSNTCWGAKKGICGAGAGASATATANLYVGNLASYVDDLRLKKLFSSFGKMIEAKVIRDPITCSSKGFGFVKFENSRDAAVAVVHMNGYIYEGRMLVVRIAGQLAPTAAASSSSILRELPPTGTYNNFTNSFADYEPNRLAANPTNWVNAAAAGSFPLHPLRAVQSPFW